MMNAKYRTDTTLLAMILAEQNARHATEAARRNKENLRWQIGLWIAAIAIIGFLSALLR